MKLLMFLIQTPKAGLSAIIVAIAQLVKYLSPVFGLNLEIPEKTLDGICDSISVIFGFVGLYFSSKGTWPTDTPTGGGPAPPATSGTATKMGMIILLAFALTFSACGGLSNNASGPTLQSQWNTLTPDQKARIVISGLQKQLELQFDQTKAYISLNPQYSAVWKFEIIPMFDKANKALKGMTETAMIAQLTPDQVYAKVQPMINELAIKLISIGMQKGGLINGNDTSSYARSGAGAVRN